MKESELEPNNDSVIGQELRKQFLIRIWFGLLLITVIGTPASISRAISTGWLPLYTFHALMGAIVVLIYLARHKLSYNILSFALLTMLFLIGAVGIFTLGLLGAGMWWLVLCSFLAGSLISQTTGIIISAISLATISLAGYLFITGHIIYPVNVDVYVTAPTSWISFLIGVSLLPFIIFQEISLFQKSTFKLLKKVNRQKVEIERLEAHDHLTGLPLLRLANDRLQMAVNTASRLGKKVAILFIDLDGFKSINDTFGHEAGDQVLKEVSLRMVKALRDIDTAARIGGDEFVLILPNIESESDSTKVSERIIEEVSKPITAAKTTVSVGASIGIAIFPDHGTDVFSLRKAADEAMYSAKKAGGNRFYVAAHAPDN